MYRFACSLQGAAHLTQSSYFSIWPLFSSTRAAGGWPLVQGHPSSRRGLSVFLICFPNPDLPRPAVRSKSSVELLFIVVKDKSGSVYNACSFSHWCVYVMLIFSLVFTVTAVQQLKLPLVTDLCLETDCDTDQALYERILHKMIILDRQRKDSLSDP